MARSCQTGHATNIIQGFAVGYESTVAALLVIVTAVILSVLCYWGTPPVFVAYGVIGIALALHAWQRQVKKE